MANPKKYMIGDKEYIQKPLVLGQVRQLVNLLKRVSLPSQINAGNIVIALGENLPEALAIVLIEEGIPLKDKDLAVVQREIEFAVSPEMAIEIVSDFFTITPIASILGKLSEATGEITKKFTEIIETSSKKL